MSARTRKTTSRRRYPLPGEEPEKEERRISPQERRRQIMINAGVWFLVLVFAMTSGVMCYNIGDPTQQEASEQAEMAQVDPTQAEIDRWQSVLASNPEDPVAMANLGYYYAQKAQTLMPAAALAEASASPAAPSPGATPAPAPSPSMSREEANSLAAEYLQKALGKDPTYAFALQQLAIVRLEEKKFGESRELLNRVLKNTEGPIPEGEDPASIEANRKTQRAQAYLALANVDYEEKKPDEALAWIEKAIVEQPGNADAYLMKASLLQDKGQVDEALAILDNAINIGQQMQNSGAQMAARLHRFQIYRSQNDNASARKELEAAQVVAQQTGNVRAMMMLSQMMYGLDAPAPGAPPMGLPTAPLPQITPVDGGSPAAEAAPDGGTAPAAEVTPAEDAQAAPAEEQGAAPAAAPAEAGPAGAPAPEATPAP